MSVCLGKIFELTWSYQLSLLILEALVHRMCLVSHMFPKLCPPGMVSFPLFLSFFQSHYPINLSELSKGSVMSGGLGGGLAYGS